MLLLLILSCQLTNPKTLTTYPYISVQYNNTSLRETNYGDKRQYSDTSLSEANYGDKRQYSTANYGNKRINLGKAYVI